MSAVQARSHGAACVAFAGRLSAHVYGRYDIRGLAAADKAYEDRVL